MSLILPSPSRQRAAIPRLCARVFAVAALVFPGLLDAQSATVAGRVLRAESGAPVESVTVSIVGMSLRTISDSRGHFAIPGVPDGAHTLEVRGIGESTARLPVLVRAGETETLEVRINAAPAELVGVTVIGKRADALARLPGSASVVGEHQLIAQRPVSANEALRTIPGVHIQEEEGAGLRANIGIRGLDPDRSRTVLVLEDGVPVSLAPYGEPEMYYSPPIDRMERVEIIKGSGSIVFGPQTIGGVVNYVTADAPETRAAQLLVQGGGGQFLNGRASFGGMWHGVRGTVGAFRKQASDWNGLRYRIEDVTGKVGTATRAGDIGLKLSAYDERSNATYVGLTDSMFRSSPHVHPQPDDRLDVRRIALTGTHELAFSAATTLRTSVYAYETTRDWTRRDYAYNSTGNSHVFRTTTGSRNRSFDVVGVEPRLRSVWTAGRVSSELEAGLRAHYEHARDKHVNSSIDASIPSVVRDDEVRTGRAAAAFVQNRFFLTSSLHITPGLRVEYLDASRKILRMRVRRSDGTRAIEDVNLAASSQDLLEMIPGIGSAWSPSSAVTVFAGAHRGFAPPRTKDAIIYEDPTLAQGEPIPAPVPLDLDAERSWNYELGTRLNPFPYLSFEATAFHLDFSNQIIEPSLSSGSVSQAQLANQGRTKHSGIELGAAFDAGRWLRRQYSLSVDLAFTLSNAVFSNDRVLMGAAGDTVNVRGNRLPYAPRTKTHASLTFDDPRSLMARIDLLRVGEQFADNFETRAGTANGRVGLIPAYTLIDVSVRYRLPHLESVSLTAGIKNVADAVYIASRRPEGIKPGAERLASIGLVWGL